MNLKPVFANLAGIDQGWITQDSRALSGMPKVRKWHARDLIKVKGDFFFLEPQFLHGGFNEKVFEATISRGIKFLRVFYVNSYLFLCLYV